MLRPVWRRCAATQRLGLAVAESKMRHGFPQIKGIDYTDAIPRRMKRPDEGGTVVPGPFSTSAAVRTLWAVIAVVAQPAGGNP